jgi:hypothetical protein
MPASVRRNGVLSRVRESWEWMASASAYSPAVVAGPQSHLHHVEEKTQHLKCDAVHSRLIIVCRDLHAALSGSVPFFTRSPSFAPRLVVR